MIQVTVPATLHAMSKNNTRSHVTFRKEVRQKLRLPDVLYSDLNGKPCQVFRKQKGRYTAKGLPGVGNGPVQVRLTGHDDGRVSYSVLMETFKNGHDVSVPLGSLGLLNSSEEYTKQFRMSRKESNLRIREAVKREIKKRRQRVEYHHNNEQIRLVECIRANGFDAKAEKDYIDVVVSTPEILFELKWDHDKGDVEHAFGHLDHLEFNGHAGIKVLLVFKPIKEKDIKWFTARHISVVMYNKNNDLYTIQNSVSGHGCLSEVIAKKRLTTEANLGIVIEGGDNNADICRSLPVQGRFDLQGASGDCGASDGNFQARLSSHIAHEGGRS